MRFDGNISCEAVGFGIASASAKARVGIVVLSGVDPLGVPEVRDNEFVYWERFEENDVRLVIPVSATIISGFEPNEDLLQWFVDKLDWKVSPRIDCGPINFLTRLPNGYREREVFPRFEDCEWWVSNNPEIPPQGSIVVREGLAFGGETLPLDNSDFGERWVILTFNGQDVHAAKIEIFFPATGNKHPEDISAARGCAFWGNEQEPPALPSYKTPNWFYYYWKAHPDPEVHFGVRWFPWGKETQSFYVPGHQNIHVSDDVWEGTEPMGSRGLWKTTFIVQHPAGNYIDIEYARAIDAFMRSVAHEKMHKILWEESQQPGWVDSDGDGVSDARELAVGLKPDRNPTFPETGLNDEELYCSHHEKGVLGDKGKDWADGHGLNHGLPSWYFTPVEVAILVR